MTPPLEDCLERLKGSSTLAGTGCTDLQLICGSVAWQPFGPDWSLLAGDGLKEVEPHDRSRYFLCRSSRLSFPSTSTQARTNGCWLPGTDLTNIAYRDWCWFIGLLNSDSDLASSVFQHKQSVRRKEEIKWIYGCINVGSFIVRDCDWWLTCSSCASTLACKIYQFQPQDFAFGLIPLLASERPCDCFFTRVELLTYIYNFSPSAKNTIMASKFHDSNTNIEVNLFYGFVMQPKLSRSANGERSLLQKFLCAMGKSMRYLGKWC